jgi:NAD(P)-dependent dehydrogenase (short-subunit alcohol dehydrogenase family)
LDITPENFQMNFNINVIGTYHAAHFFIPLLVESLNGAKGFIAICSMSAATVHGSVAHAAYCASNLAQARVVEMIGLQYGDKGSLAVALHPGGVRTAAVDFDMPEEIGPSKRNRTPTEFNISLNFLLSPLPFYMLVV